LNTMPKNYFDGKSKRKPNDIRCAWIIWMRMDALYVCVYFLYVYMYVGVYVLSIHVYSTGNTPRMRWSGISFRPLMLLRMRQLHSMPGCYSSEPLPGRNFPPFGMFGQISCIDFILYTYMHTYIHTYM
jgi:hypothetical protein